MRRKAIATESSFEGNNLILKGCQLVKWRVGKYVYVKRRKIMRTRQRR